jgi:hypothetical protein
VDEVALGQVFSEYFSFPPTLIPPTAPRSSSSGASTLGQIVTDVPSGLTVTAPTKISCQRQFLFYSESWLLEVALRFKGNACRHILLPLMILFTLFCFQRGPLSLVSTTKKLLDRKVAAPV